METVIAFIISNRFMISVIVCAILYITSEWQKAKSIAYSLMLTARRMAQKKILESGKSEEDWVVSNLYKFLPKRITIFIKEDFMRKIVHFLFVKAKDYSDDGAINGSVE